MFRILVLIPLLTVFLSACGAPNSTTRGPGGSAVYGEYHVRWFKAPAALSQVRDGLTPLMFTFIYAGQSASTVTEADWAREARLQGSDVHTMKTILGNSVYVTPQGRIASCTFFAKDKGLCSHGPELSTRERAHAAQSILAKSSACRWVGFDTNYHQAQAYRAGAQSATLHIRADC